MTTKPQYKFKIGDRVAERPKLHGIFATTSEGFEAAKKCRQQRYGTVVDIKTKRGKSNRAVRYLYIKWDGLATPTSHAQMRICHISDFDKIMNDICMGIGE